MSKEKQEDEKNLNTQSPDRPKEEKEDFNSSLCLIFLLGTVNNCYCLRYQPNSNIKLYNNIKVFIKIKNKKQELDFGYKKGPMSCLYEGYDVAFIHTPLEMYYG